MAAVNHGRTESRGSEQSAGSAGQIILATASYDGTIRLWEALRGICWKVISLQDKVQVNKLAITPNKKYIAGACTQKIRLWDISASKNEPMCSYEGHVGNVTAVGFQRAGRWMYSAGEDGSIRVWDLRAPKCQMCFWNETATGAVGTRGGPEPTTFGGGAPAAAARAAEEAASSDKTTDAKNADGAPYHYGGGQCRVYCAELHPNQGEIASGDAGGSVRVWDLVASKCRAELRPDKGTPVASLAYARDASLLVAGCFDGTVYAWQPPEGSKHSQVPEEAEASRAGDAAASRGGAGTDKGASLEATPSGAPSSPHLGGVGGGMTDGAGGYTPVKRLRAHRSYVLGAKVSPHMRLAATASADRTVRLWSLPDWTRVTTLTGHSKWVWDVVFSADSQYLVTASSDGQARLWDSSGDTIATYVGHERAVCCVAMHDADATAD